MPQQIPLLRQLLEQSELDYSCLFSGKSREELETVAPYIVRLKEDDSFTQGLFTSAKMPEDLWDKEAGIFIRSKASLPQLRKHFRRFTRVQDEGGKWYYFRFWEQTMLRHFSTGTGTQNLMNFFGEKFEIQTLDEEKNWRRTYLNPKNKRATSSSKAIILRAADFKSFKTFKHTRYFTQLKSWLLKTYPSYGIVKNVDEFLKAEIQFAIDKFKTSDQSLISNYVAVSWILREMP